MIAVVYILHLKCCPIILRLHISCELYMWKGTFEIQPKENKMSTLILLTQKLEFGDYLFLLL